MHKCATCMKYDGIMWSESLSVNLVCLSGLSPRDLGLSGLGAFHLFWFCLSQRSFVGITFSCILASLAGMCAVHLGGSVSECFFFLVERVLYFFILNA